MDMIQMEKERIINDYLSSLNISDLTIENIDINLIKKGLKDKLGEEPAIELEYERTEILNEINNKIKTEKLKTIIVTYTIEKKYNDIDIPCPVKTYIPVG
jgi:hypothetical protein